MKFTIKYEFEPKYGSETPFWASAYGISRCGATYTIAREKLIEELRQVAEVTRQQTVEPPPDEEVDL